MLNLHEMERLPPWIENMPVEARDKLDIQNAMQHQKNQGKKGNSQKVQREARINCKSKDVYMQINLNDLEAYTQDVLKNERDRQRQCWCRSIVVCLSLTIFAIGAGAAIMTEDIQSTIFDQLPKKYKNSIRVPPPPTTGNSSNANQTYSHNIAMENPAAASTTTSTTATKPSSGESQEKSPAASTATATSSSNATSTTEENPAASTAETATTTATITPSVSQTEEKPAASTVTTYASNVTSEAHHQQQEHDPAPTTPTITTSPPASSSSSSTSSPAHPQQEEAEEDPSYILSTCEREVNSNHSFSFLLQRIQSHDTDMPMCRPEAPQCDWLNPTLPKPRQSKTAGEMDAWNKAFLRNQELVADLVEHHKAVLDVVLVGDSIVEHIQGKEETTTSLQRDHEVFSKLFTKQGGGFIDGLPLGIAGDRCSNLLYRLESGSLADPAFAPKVWWILIGTEDWEQGLGPDAIVAGIVATVKSIRSTHGDDAQIVVNSLLPRYDREENQWIQNINERLGCFVKTQTLIDSELEYQKEQEQLAAAGDSSTGTGHFRRIQRMHFFNATNVFVERKEDGSYVVNPALMMEDEGTLDAQAEYLWGKKIVETVLHLIEK